MFQPPIHNRTERMPQRDSPWNAGAVEARLKSIGNMAAGLVTLPGDVARLAWSSQLLQPDQPSSGFTQKKKKKKKKTQEGTEKIHLKLYRH